jgi:hypothetical protein
MSRPVCRRQAAARSLQAFRREITVMSLREHAAAALVRAREAGTPVPATDPPHRRRLRAALARDIKVSGMGSEIATVGELVAALARYSPDTPSSGSSTTWTT